ncbi:hypothetical protein AEAC466_03175 [Asticcacaulis sp. AC466]|uniref:hypothetical protein n=1 Tax=Asticcacaulis sp. AC466 TaxID=1282362 RepID=UPI0003C3F714|nr:hypothetical protein [Asticcacaulis sp. AC466]ESQ86211.1 hypothetical protein AEAC466_03175 [Asticcacaulis sp. AC466]
MSSIESLSACISPLQTAKVFNPMRPEYYRADEMKAPKPKDTSTRDGPAVTITLSDEAKAAIEG